MENVTQLLNAVARGERQAGADLLEEVYTELRNLAALRLAQEKPGQTLQPTALVHEAWLRVTNGDESVWDGRSHFFAAAAEAMRRILVDRARQKQRIRHGGDLTRVDVQHLDMAVEEDSETVLTVDELLDRLHEEDPTAAELIKLRFFMGMPNHEAAAALGLSEGAAKRRWAYARAWLYRELNGKA